MDNKLIMKAVKERIEELKEEWLETEFKNSNHLTSMLSGELDGLLWVEELLIDIEQMKKSL